MLNSDQLDVECLEHENEDFLVSFRSINENCELEQKINEASQEIEIIDLIKEPETETNQLCTVEEDTVDIEKLEIQQFSSNVDLIINDDNSSNGIDRIINLSFGQEEKDEKDSYNEAAEGCDESIETLKTDNGKSGFQK